MTNLSKDEKNMILKKNYSSIEVMKKLKISSCELMHLREAGKFEFKKRGNAYLYEKKSVDNYTLI